MHLRICLSGIQAGGKSRGIQAQLGSIALEDLDGVLFAAPVLGAGKEAVVHGPESLSALPCSTQGSFASLPRLRVNGIQWVLQKDQSDLACGNVRFIQKRARLQCVTGTEWSLEL